jgi:hypothetical protein
MGVYIQTERGTKRLMPEESGRGLGIPKEWRVDPKHIMKGGLEQTTTLFHWEYLSATLSRAAQTAEKYKPLPHSITWDETRGKTRRVPTDHSEFSWKPPDLQEGKAWHQK